MKKRILVFILLIIFMTGCEKCNVSKEKEMYVNYIKELKEVKKSSTNIPFDIEIKYDKLTNNEVRYQVIIDNVKENIYNISAITIHNKETQDVFPSIGIFDEKETLKVNEKPSGLILVGYIDYSGKLTDFKCVNKVLIKYVTENKKMHKVYYVTKK
ncbi:MAG: hypothetical protein IIZ40_04490 [Bacilli bacterium]|nr:hypothetical protein [Bacilli bacterium]